MNGNKYILTDEDDYVIFTPLIDHSKMANVLRGEPISAGFCDVIGDEDDCGNPISKVRVWGESVTLGIKAVESDGDKISKMMNKWVMGY